MECDRGCDVDCRRELRPDPGLYVGLTQAAVYDAVIAIDGGFRPYLIVPGVPPGSSDEAAAAAAAYGVLVGYFPAQKPALDTAYATSLAGIPDDDREGPWRPRWTAGRSGAAGRPDRRRTQRRSAVRPHARTGSLAADAACVPPGAHSVAGSDETVAARQRLAVPARAAAALDSPQYARDFNETRLYGALNGSLRTPQQTETALFYTENAALQYNRALRSFVAARDMNLRDAARALAMADTTMADALIACWDAKNTYAFWRPVTAIAAGGTDGNDRTKATRTGCRSGRHRTIRSIRRHTIASRERSARHCRRSPATTRSISTSRAP